MSKRKLTNSLCGTIVEQNMFTLQSLMTHLGVGEKSMLSQTVKLNSKFEYEKVSEEDFESTLTNLNYVIKNIEDGLSKLKKSKESIERDFYE